MCEHTAGTKDLAVVLHISSGFTFLVLIKGLSVLSRYIINALSGLVVIVLAIGPKVHTFKPSRGRWIFKGDTIHSMTLFGGEV
jgi:hypothetical protein